MLPQVWIGLVQVALTIGALIVVWLRGQGTASAGSAADKAEWQRRLAEHDRRFEQAGAKASEAGSRMTGLPDRLRSEWQKDDQKIWDEVYRLRDRIDRRPA